MHLNFPFGLPSHLLRVVENAKKKREIAATIINNNSNNNDDDHDDHDHDHGYDNNNCAPEHIVRIYDEYVVLLRMVCGIDVGQIKCNRCYQFHHVGSNNYKRKTIPKKKKKKIKLMLTPFL
ncbi:hypothetical protein RFI_38317 [Reticulomyxa filosa]|uniref:Uncharacterized protein n=1 Tax=Reticulomyxa filosa TaxID=46433 RepID=X6LEI1_RETFI|nr:hypothetical protein RFI_38317 [Reticulomyxa filosa]|eukprot:ETN99164.1 hypothetical protein RFI_38317 [Reticulomyxa filosa]